MVYSCRDYLKDEKKSCSSELRTEKGALGKEKEAFGKESFEYMKVLEWCFSFLCML